MGMHPSGGHRGGCAGNLSVRTAPGAVSHVPYTEAAQKTDQFILLSETEALFQPFILFF